MGDNVNSLPVSKEHSPKPGELEFMHNLFQPKNKVLIEQTVSPFKPALLGAFLFLILSLPFISKLVEKITNTKNTVYVKGILAIIFLILFFIGHNMLINKSDKTV